MKAHLFGLNLVDWNSPDYVNWDGRLASACRDASALMTLNTQFGGESEIWLSRWGGMGQGQMSPYVIGQTTRDAWRTAWTDAARGKPGDSFLFLYSGHGYRQEYALKSEEGLCFFDGLLPDYEQHELYAAVPEGVNVVVWLDACHAGGMDKGGLIGAVKAMPWGTVNRVFQPAPVAKGRVRGNILILAAAETNESALDGPTNAAWTGSMLAMLDPHRRIPWGDWFDRTAEHMAKDTHLRVQTPCRITLGGGESLLRQEIFQ